MVREPHHIVDNTLNRAVELSLAVYRITDKFPTEEVLTQKMRLISIDIIENLVYNGHIPANSSGFFNLSGASLASRDNQADQPKCDAFGWEDWGKKVRVLFVYFSLAEKQGWVSEGNFTALRREYVMLYKIAEKEKSNGGADKSAIPKTVKTGQAPKKIKEVPVNKPTKRQERILRFIKGKANGAQIVELAELVEASNKTVERELKKLISRKLVQKTGQTRGARFIIDN